MNESQRREQILAASAARRQQLAAQPPPQPTAAVSAPPVETPQQKFANRQEWSPPNSDIKIKRVPKGTRPSPGMPRQQGPNAMNIDAGARSQRRPQGNVMPVQGRAGSSVRQVGGGTSPHRGGVQPVQSVQPFRTQSQTGVEASMMIPAGQARPAPAASSSAPVVDLSVILSYHARPHLVDPQQRLLLAQSVQPMARVAWVNPSDRGRFPAPVLATIAKMPNNQPNVDMGPWMRWGVAAMCSTEYVAVFDDDCMPGPRWLELALARLESADENTVIAAGGILYDSDDANDFRLVGPEGPEAQPQSELEVDVGRGAWVMRTSTARMIAGFARVADMLSTGLHVASVVQEAGALTLVLPYANRDHAGWGMLEASRPELSMSNRLDEEHAAGRAPVNASAIRQQVFAAHRDEGWMPMCVATAETVREHIEEFVEELATAGE